jgi:hypothetical protein
MTKKTSKSFTLYGDLDGVTVADLRKILNDYPDNARIDVRSEAIYGYEQHDCFVFEWNA